MAASRQVSHRPKSGPVIALVISAGLWVVLVVGVLRLIRLTIG